MSHEITETDGFFAVRRPGWHGLGVTLEDYPTRAEAQAIAQKPLQEHARVLSAMLGLGDDAGASFEFASAAQLCAELAILGPWNLVAADNWPPDLMERGAQLFSCEWHNGGKPDGL